MAGLAFEQWQAFVFFFFGEGREGGYDFRALPFVLDLNSCFFLCLGQTNKTNLNAGVLLLLNGRCGCWGSTHNQAELIQLFNQIDQDNDSKLNGEGTTLLTLHSAVVFIWAFIFTPSLIYQFATARALLPPAVTPNEVIMPKYEPHTIPKPMTCLFLFMWWWEGGAALEHLIMFKWDNWGSLFLA